jgi:hypothetical protein
LLLFGLYRAERFQARHKFPEVPFQRRRLIVANPAKSPIATASYNRLLARLHNRGLCNPSKHCRIRDPRERYRPPVRRLDGQVDCHGHNIQIASNVLEWRNPGFVGHGFSSRAEEEFASARLQRFARRPTSSAHAAR